MKRNAVSAPRWQSQAHRQKKKKKSAVNRTQANTHQLPPPHRNCIVAVLRYYVEALCIREHVESVQEDDKVLIPGSCAAVGELYLYLPWTDALHRDGSGLQAALHHVYLCKSPLSLPSSTLLYGFTENEREMCSLQVFSCSFFIFVSDGRVIYRPLTNPITLSRSPFRNGLSRSSFASRDTRPCFPCRP